MHLLKHGALALMTMACLSMAHRAHATLAAGPPPAQVSGTDSKPEARFAVWEYRVLGNTQLAPREIESTLYPLLGPDKTFASIEEARATLEKYYHDHGLGTVYVDIPEQEVVDGIVRLRVTEGRLSRVRVTGARYFGDRVILANLEEAKAGSVPNVTVLQQELAALNAQTPDRTVVPVLHAGETPGTVDLDLKVQDHLPLHGSVELNNAYTVDTKPLRLNASLSYDNVAQRGDSVSFQYQTAPQSSSDIDVVAGTYVFKFGAGYPALAVYAVNTNSNVAALGTLNVLGAGDIFGTRLVWPIVTTVARSDSVSIGVDYKKFRNTINVTTGEVVPTNVDYLPFNLNYSTTLTGGHGTTILASTLTWAVRGLVSTAGAFESARKGAPTDFVYLRADATRLQELPFGFSAALQFDGQASSSPLIANEQFTAGGVASVRGYFESEELGDSGIRGSLELHTPMLFRPLIKDTQFYLFGFFDWASIEIQDTLSTQPSSHTLRSTGAGFRLDVLSHFDAFLDWAHPLVSSSRTPAGDNRYNFSVKYAF